MGPYSITLLLSKKAMRDPKSPHRFPRLVHLGLLLLLLAPGLASVEAQPSPEPAAAATMALADAEAGAEATSAEIERPRPGWLALLGVIAFVLLLSQRRVVRHDSVESA